MLLKNLSESFDLAQDKRRRFEIIDAFPFMLINMKAMYFATSVDRLTAKEEQQYGIHRTGRS